jgi:hypothetical protein
MEATGFSGMDMGSALRRCRGPVFSGCRSYVSFSCADYMERPSVIRGIGGSNWSDSPAGPHGGDAD